MNIFGYALSLLGDEAGFYDEGELGQSIGNIIFNYRFFWEYEMLLTVRYPRSWRIRVGGRR